MARRTSKATKYARSRQILFNLIAKYQGQGLTEQMYDACLRSLKAYSTSKDIDKLVDCLIVGIDKINSPDFITLCKLHSIEFSHDTDSNITE